MFVSGGMARPCTSTTHNTRLRRPVPHGIAPWGCSAPRPPSHQAPALRPCPCTLHILPTCCLHIPCPPRTRLVPRGCAARASLHARPCARAPCQPPAPKAPVPHLGVGQRAPRAAYGPQPLVPAEARRGGGRQRCAVLPAQRLHAPLVQRAGHLVRKQRHIGMALT